MELQIRLTPIELPPSTISAPKTQDVGVQTEVVEETTNSTETLALLLDSVSSVPSVSTPTWEDAGLSFEKPLFPELDLKFLEKLDNFLAHQ